MRSIQVNPTFKRRTLLLGMVGTVAELAGCGGGGGDVAGLSTGGTGSFTSGTISGLGSIIVNGIRYNDDNATLISSDDGSSFGDTLKVGMVVSIQGSSVTAATTTNGTATATAYRISCGSEWEGPVSSVGATSFDMLGLTVDVLATTVFEGAATQMTGLTTAHFVEVHGYVDQTTGHLQASRVEVSVTAPTHYKLSGVVQNLDAGNRTFKVGTSSQRSNQISWDTQTVIPTSWSDGVFVRVKIAAATPLLATQIRLLTSPLTQLSADDERDAEIHGFISAFVSIANFTVNGIPVDASTARIAGGTLALGVRVEVHGSISNGVLVATKVETPSNTDVATREFEFHGEVSALDTLAKTFALHGLTFRYDSNTSIQVAMANGVRIEIKAKRASGAWLATEIRADD